MRELYLTLPLLVFLFSGLLMLLILRGNARSPLHRVFSLMLLAMTLWGLTIFGMRASSGTDTAIIWERAALVAILAVSLFFYQFTRLFTRQTGERSLLLLMYVASIGATGLVALGLVVPEMQEKWYGYAPRFGPLFAAYLFLVYLATFLGIRNLLRYYLHPPSHAARNRTLYILLGVACSLLGGISDSLPPLMSTFPIGISGNLFFVLFTSVAIMKHNLLDIRVAIEKGFVYSIVSAVILGIYVSLLFFFNILFQNNASILSWPGNLAAVLTVAILLKPLLDRVQKVADNWFRRRRYDYLRALEGFSHETKDITDLKQLAIVLEQFVTRAIGAEDVLLLIPSGNSNQFTSVTEGNSKDSRPFKFRAKSPAVVWLRSHDDVLRQEDLKTFPAFLPLSAQEQTQLEKYQIQLLIPMKHQEELVGILVLSRKRSEEPYSEEDLDLLRAIANQTAMGLANARLFASVVSQRTRLEQLLERVIGAQEDERKRLSMELHDSPVQWLTSTVYRLEACLEFFHRGQYQRAWKELEEVQGVLDKTLSELRHTTATLHPPELEKVGLVKALARHVDAFERDTGTPVSFEEDGFAPRLPAPVELAAYRVIQEALSNVRKHSEATRVQITLGQNNGAFRAVVRDNGIGFEVDDSRPNDNKHLGLVGMEERARMLGGTLSIHSMPRAGTQVALMIPLPRPHIDFDQPVEATIEPETKHPEPEAAVWAKSAS
ncbi:MAG: ATP-binding protein, partial [Dehalococcoidia bacterium]